MFDREKRKDSSNVMKDIIMHIAIVLFGCGLIIYTIFMGDNIKMFTAICFTVAWSVVLLERILKHRREKTIDDE
jgi:hypothetical protein